jgi:Zn-dependent protease
MYFPKGSLDPGKPGQFSMLEVKHIILAMIVITFAFSFNLTHNSFLNLFSLLYPESAEFVKIPDIFEVLFFLPVSFLGVVTAFFVHEISHKIMAQRYRLWAEFRMYPLGLFFAFFIAILTGVVFAAPGAVMFRGDSRTYETGRIAMAGPLSNIFISGIFFMIYRFGFFELLFNKLIGFICFINAILAIFNLLPLGPLDGVKIVRWNPLIWSILFIIATILVISFLPFIPLLELFN